MKEVDSTKPPTEVGEPTLSSQECDVSKVQTGINGYHYMNLNGKLYIRAIIQKCAIFGLG